MSLLRREMACQELVELVTAYFEDALSGRERRSFDAHIAGCDHCNAYLEEMRLTIDATGRLSEDDIAPEARDELLRVFRDWHRERTA
jgi:anti-sigma factor RsiW